MQEHPVLIDIASNGVATITMNRGEAHNAFDEALISDFTDLLVRAGNDRNVRAVIVRGKGKSFSAGADIAWMRRLAGYSEAENLADANGLARLLQTLVDLPKPTIAAVHGSAIGGGIGIVAACDIAIAAESAMFGLSEVRLGLIPSLISPYVIAAIGERACRRYFLTGERFPAATACQLGLLHKAVPDDALDQTIDAIVAEIIKGSPDAIQAAKSLISAVARKPLNDAIVQDTCHRIVQRRLSADGQEGIAAFLERRKPSWIG